jgi:hypothetical protein
LNSLDHKTRGRTRPGRLRALDAYLVRQEHALLSRTDGPWERAAFVDVGFGEHPWTPLESAQSFRALNPHLPVTGVELEAQRVEAAAPYTDTLTSFRQGGFDLPLGPQEPARLVRAMNLLRQYPPEQVPAVHQRLGERLLPSGLLVEGSSDTHGGVLVAHLLRRGPLHVEREALLFYTDFSHGFAPLLFRDWLPRDLRRRVLPGTPIHAFFTAWTQAWQHIRAQGHVQPAAAFIHSALRLAEEGVAVKTDGWLLENGYLVWSA